MAAVAVAVSKSPLPVQFDGSSIRLCYDENFQETTFVAKCDRCKATFYPCSRSDSEDFADFTHYNSAETSQKCSVLHSSDENLYMKFGPNLKTTNYSPFDGWSVEYIKSTVVEAIKKMQAAQTSHS